MPTVAGRGRESTPPALESCRGVEWPALSLCYPAPGQSVSHSLLALAFAKCVFASRAILCDTLVPMTSCAQVGLPSSGRRSLSLPLSSSPGTHYAVPFSGCPDCSKALSAGARGIWAHECCNTGV